MIYQHLGGVKKQETPVIVASLPPYLLRGNFFTHTQKKAQLFLDVRLYLFPALYLLFNADWTLTYPSLAGLTCKLRSVSLNVFGDGGIKRGVQAWLIYFIFHSFLHR